MLNEDSAIDHALDQLEDLHARLDRLLELSNEVLHRLDLVESCEPLEYTDMEARRGY